LTLLGDFGEAHVVNSNREPFHRRPRRHFYVGNFFEPRMGFHSSGSNAPSIDIFADRRYSVQALGMGARARRRRRGRSDHRFCPRRAPLLRAGLLRAGILLARLRPVLATRNRPLGTRVLGESLLTKPVGCAEERFSAAPIIWPRATFQPQPVARPLLAPPPPAGSFLCCGVRLLSIEADGFDT
jgi:hypothetical protein